MPALLDRLHRMSFRAVSLLPVAAHGRVLRRFFQWTHRVPDPWRYESEPYELARHETTVRHIPGRAYRRVLDVGCGEGAFTRRLAGALPGARCWGVDVSDRAIVRAATRGGTAGFAALDVLTETPEGVFDLVICAETLYYAGRGRRLRLLLSRLRSFMAPGGVLVLVHEWPEARRLYRYLDGDPSLRKVSEHPYDDPSRPYAVTVYEHVGSPAPEPAPEPAP
ncbi:class I SAM-dependent methyltransferase, partial [Nonomuraea mesophila]